MSRPLVLLAAGAAALAVLAAPAGATNECRGLEVCVPVAGPWVVVPVGEGVPRPQVEFQLSCPAGHVVGGLDAELSHRGIDVAFLGTMGSPVNPGITTSRSAVFVASYTGGGRPAASFRPHLGCLPAQGGGTRIPVAHTAFPPGAPPTRRARLVRVPAGAGRVVARQGCARGEELVSGWHALAFRTAEPPTARQVAGVRAGRAVRRDQVVVSVRSGGGLEGGRAVVQVGAVCAGAA